MGARAQEEPRASAQVRILKVWGGTSSGRRRVRTRIFPGQGRLGRTCQPAAAARHSRPAAARARPAYCTTPGCTCGHGSAPPTASRPRACAGGGPWRSVEQTPLFTSRCAPRRRDALVRNEPGAVLESFFGARAPFRIGGMRKTFFVVGLALTFTNADSAISRPALRARWSATDGFSDASFCSFNAARYQGMVEDEERTTMFAEAIRDALRRRPGAVVLVSLILGSTANPNPVTRLGYLRPLSRRLLSHLLSGQAPLVVSRLYLLWRRLVWLLLPWLCLPRAGHRHGPRGVAGPHRGACWREEGLCRGGAA